MAEGWRGWPGHLAKAGHFSTIEAALRDWLSATPHRPPGKSKYEIDRIGKLGRNESLLQTDSGQPGCGRLHRLTTHTRR
jgi:hypothetical protein